MKFEKPFHIKLKPTYCINEPSDFREMSVINETTKDLGGIKLNVDENELNPDYNMYRSGGRMDWSLYSEPDSQKPEINIQLMRIWALQMVTQMINEKAYVNEIHSEPKFNISEDDKNIFLDIIVEMTNNLHKELEIQTDSVVRLKKYKFNFENDEK
jgi:hypothetical protein